MAVTLPTVGGDNNAWGGILNTALSTHDTQIAGKADASHGNHFVVSVSDPAPQPDGVIWVVPV